MVGDYHCTQATKLNDRYQPPEFHRPSLGGTGHKPMAENHLAPMGLPEERRTTEGVPWREIRWLYPCHCPCLLASKPGWGTTITGVFAGVALLAIAYFIPGKHYRVVQESMIG